MDKPTFDVNLDDLEDQRGSNRPVPKMVPGRVVHIDGDFLAYMVSYDDSKPVLEMQHNCSVKIESIRLMAGAEKVQVHLTPKDSTKGNRGAIAIQKEYQGNRKGKAKPRFLHMIRDYMATEHDAIMAREYEADDSMAMAVHQARLAGTPELAVIATKDKDLKMIPGLQLDWDTGELNDTKDDFGFIEIKETKSGTKKVTGRGYKFFFAQLLMGDTADNIQGIPKVVVDGKLKACGPVLTYNLLKDTTSVKECFDLVVDLFRKTGEKQPYIHWETKEPVSANKVIVSEMKLLWMRRVNDENDVLHFLKENQ